MKGLALQGHLGYASSREDGDREYRVEKTENSSTMEKRSHE